MERTYYNHDIDNIKAITHRYPGIKTPDDLYKALSHVWCKETCAERMRDKWTRANKTLGQCSVTAFLAQDIFGGKVMGIPLPDGNVHCYNVVGEGVFDLTSEQFKGKELDYTDNPEQFRENHFAAGDKKERYDRLTAKLSEYLTGETYADYVRGKSTGSKKHVNPLKKKIG